MSNVFADSLETLSKNNNHLISQNNQQHLKSLNVVTDKPKPDLTDNKVELIGPAYIITMHQTIDGGLANSVKRRIEIAEMNNASIIIFDIDTFGGRLDSAFEISENISDIKKN